MNKIERHKKILELLKINNEVFVNELSESLKTSKMTIRRDLNDLSEEYNIIRTHGGAKIENNQIVKSITFDDFKILNKDKKIEIARYAAAYIKDGYRIYIDSGSTVRLILEYIDYSDINSLVIITNNLDIAIKAAKLPKVSVSILGGDIIPKANCSSGIISEKQIKNYHFDLSFISCSSIGKDGNLYDGYSPEASIKKYLFDLSDKILLLADSSKFCKYDIHPFASIDMVDTVLTDDSLNDEAKNLLNKYNTNYVISKK